MTDDLKARLRSQIGDDVQKIYDHEALFKAVLARIEELEAALRDAERVALERAAKVAEKMQKDVDDTNDEFALRRLPGVCIDPDGHDIASALRALIPQPETPAR